MRKLKSKSILDRAIPIEESTQSMTALFYGRSGTGKTTLSGSFPKPLLLIDIGEKGQDSVADQKGIKVIRVNSWQDMEDIYWELKSGNHEYNSVVIDAIHSMQDLAVLEAKRLAKKKEEDQTSQKDWGQVSNLMRTWIFNYRDLSEENINVVFLAHDRTRETEAEDEELSPEVGPKLTPSIASLLMGAVNVVGYTFIKSSRIKSEIRGKAPKKVTSYCLRIGPHSVYSTKIRVPKSMDKPEFIEDPTYDKIQSVITGNNHVNPKINRRRK